jgi:hypothetical protein
VLADRVLDILPPEVTLEAGEGTLGTWRFLDRTQAQNWECRVLKMGTSFVANHGCAGRVRG